MKSLYKFGLASALLLLMNLVPAKAFASKSPELPVDYTDRAELSSRLASEGHAGGVCAAVLPVEHHRMADHARRTTGPGRVRVAETRQSTVRACAFNLHTHLGTGFRRLTGYRR